MANLSVQAYMALIFVERLEQSIKRLFNGSTCVSCAVVHIEVESQLRGVISTVPINNTEAVISSKGVRKLKMVAVGT